MYLYFFFNFKIYLYLIYVLKIVFLNWSYIDIVVKFLIDYYVYINV